MDKRKTLTPEILQIVQHKGTEPPHIGKYTTHEGQGTYLCRQCGLALFRSTHKFLSACGWPSFDDELPDALVRYPDADGMRTEICCGRCDAHLGHVFEGEKHTENDLRHCVNSLAIEFVGDVKIEDTEEAIYAGGCFWGVEHLLKAQDGVLITEVGYIGGHLDHPSYQAVCQGDTGHQEAVRVVFDPKRIDFAALTKCFFEIHDPTQSNGQGPDLGDQYRSVIFYLDDSQKQIAMDLITELRENGYDVKTELQEASVFWPAEDHHQNYYQKNQKSPYCHVRVERFTKG